MLRLVGGQGGRVGARRVRAPARRSCQHCCCCASTAPFPHARRAIWGAVAAARVAKGLEHVPNVVATSVEHPAVLECLAALQRHGLATYTLVGVGAAGAADPGELAAAIQPGTTALVTVMHRRARCCKR